MTGFIYLLRNETMPGLVKIGKTARLPDERSRELFTTGVAQPFEVAFAIYVDDIGEFERLVHDELTDYRVSDQREFFRVDEDKAIEAVLNTYFPDADFNLSVVHSEMAMDEGRVCWYAHVCGQHPFSIPQVIDEISPAAWKAASAAYEEKCQQRRERQGVNSG